MQSRTPVLVMACALLWTNITTAQNDLGGLSAPVGGGIIERTGTEIQFSPNAYPGGGQTDPVVPRITAVKQPERLLIAPSEQNITITEAPQQPLIEPRSPWSLPTFAVPTISMPEHSRWSTDSWLTSTLWDGSIEFGLNGSAGNSEALSLRAGANVKRTTEQHELTADLTYIKSTADGSETANNAIFNGRDEWLLGESPWSLFATTGLEYDEFRAFDLRLVLSAGVGYRLVDDGVTKMATRFGSGTSREFGGPDERWVPEANLGLDYERKIDERQTFSTTIDYYPEWGEFADYRLNTAINWQVLLSEETNMSLKLSALDRYDSTPNGRKASDITYSALLLWNF
jgi:putative salt-induced outer membrane protein YdiY